ncbi:MAG: rRNA maturation RNase YbeY [Planctomycetota bacterium]|jgi:probable rRNA maturation factor
MEIPHRDRVRFANLQSLPLDTERLLDLLAFTLPQLGLELPVSLAVVNDETIASINARFTGKAETTDVLAFPLLDAHQPDPDPELGEIVVSAETAARQAEEAGIPFEREMALLALHGLLHLAGWGDADPESRERMQRKGEALLQAFEKEAPA